MATIFERLAIKIKNDLDIDAVNFRRTYVGYWQRAQGSWVWVCNEKDNSVKDIGSVYSATELLKFDKLCICKDGTILSND